MQKRTFILVWLSAMQMNLPAVAAQPSKFSGEWVHSDDMSNVSYLNLKLKGHSVSGSYEFAGHRCFHGVIKGRLKGAGAQILCSFPPDENPIDPPLDHKVKLSMAKGKLTWVESDVDGDPSNSPTSVVYARQRPYAKSRTDVDLVLGYRRKPSESDNSLNLSTSNRNLPWFMVVREKNNEYSLKKFQSAKNSRMAQSTRKNVLFMVRGLKCVPGPIQYSSLVNKRPTIRNPVDLTAGTRKYAMKLKSTDKWRVSEILSDGINEQTIAYMDARDKSKALKIIWIGDLDRDGRLDFLIDAHENAGYGFGLDRGACDVLLLSSANAEIAGLAASSSRD